MTSATRQPHPFSKPAGAPERAPDGEQIPAIVEPPVFVAPDGRRARRLRLAGRVVAGLVGLWVLALLAGAVGFGHLSGLNLPRIAGSHPSRPDAATKRASRERRKAGSVASAVAATVGPSGASVRRGRGGSSSRSNRLAAGNGGSVADSLGNVGSGAPSGSRRTSSPTRSRRGGANGSAPASAPATTPTGTGQRRGQTTTPSGKTTPAATKAPPGQTRKTGTTAPTTPTTTTTSPGSSGTSHGQANGHTKTSSP